MDRKEAGGERRKGKEEDEIVGRECEAAGDKRHPRDLGMGF